MALNTVFISAFLVVLSKDKPPAKKSPTLYTYTHQLANYTLDQYIISRWNSQCQNL